jgi:hypothetical protein
MKHRATRAAGRQIPEPSGDVELAIHSVRK